MNSEQDANKNLIDTTDCLEAVSVFRGWKNFLFVILIIFMLLLQASFWLVDTGYVKIEKPCGGKSPAVSDPKQAGEVATETEENIEKAAQEAVSPEKPSEAVPQPQPEPAKAGFRIEFEHVAALIRFVDFVLVLAGILYCLTMLFALKISLVGRLGGINHISRAFFISLAFVVLLLPWQKFFGRVVFGAIYTPWELARLYSDEAISNVFSVVFYYFRFVGYWLIVFLLLIFSFARSGKWARTILRRLEVV